MTEIHVSGSNYNEALAQGLEQLGVARELVEVEELFSAHDDTLPGAEPLEGVTLRLRVKAEELTTRAKAHLLELLRLMGVEAQVEVLHRRGNVILNIVGGSDGSLIIGRNGQNLEALQILINRMVVHGGRELLPIVVDSEGYRERRMQRLEQTAERAARQALRQGKEVALEPMPASERKIVHNALKEIRGVHTISRGEGPARHVVITPGSPSMSSGLLRPGKRAPGAKGAIADPDTLEISNPDDFRTDIDALLAEDEDD